MKMKNQYMMINNLIIIIKNKIYKNMKIVKKNILNNDFYIYILYHINSILFSLFY